MEVYGIKCSVENILNLDSSTEEKFSRHLIFILQNAAFKDNIHVGMFRLIKNVFFFISYANYLFTLCDIFVLLLGRFIHAILQPVINKIKRDSDLEKENNSPTENNENRLVLFVRNNILKYFFSSLNNLCNFMTILTEKQRFLRCLQR